MLKVALTSDTHVGLTKMKALENCFTEMAAHKPDVVVHAGDFCGGHMGDRSVRSTFRLLRRIFPDIPILAVLGNHDYWCGKPRVESRDGDWTVFTQYRPSLSTYQLNLNKIRTAFVESNIFFLDEYGPFRIEGVTFVGHTGWYKLFVATNDLLHLPSGLGGDTFRHFQRAADTEVMVNLGLLTEEDTNRVFVSHFPVIDPRDFGWSEKLGELLVENYQIKKFLNGHMHERHEGPLKYEAGSDYGSPRYLIIEV